MLVHQAISDWIPAILAQLQTLSVVAYGTSRVRQLADLRLLEAPLGHERANDPDHVASVSIDVVDSLEQACQLANAETSGLVAAIVTENPDAAQDFFRAYRGSTVLWQASTRFTDGHALLQVPETAIDIGRASGPRGPVSYRDLWLKQLHVVGDSTQQR